MYNRVGGSPHKRGECTSHTTPDSYRDGASIKVSAMAESEYKNLKEKNNG
ncbi:MAG: hypothetical protein H6607_05295 [Flavobacteriales bacterium]|nr:hypothetical protein [Flavobacteriales bacterium]